MTPRSIGTKCVSTSGIESLWLRLSPLRCVYIHLYDLRATNFNPGPSFVLKDSHCMAFDRLWYLLQLGLGLSRSQSAMVRKIFRMLLSAQFWYVAWIFLIFFGKVLFAPGNGWIQSFILSLNLYRDYEIHCPIGMAQGFYDQYIHIVNYSNNEANGHILLNGGRVQRQC